MNVNQDFELYKLLISGDTDGASALIGGGLDISYITKDMGWTYLHRLLNAIRITPSTDGVLLLLKMGIDVNQADFGGWTPLHFAARAGFVDIAECLINHGAVVDVPNKDGHTPLWLAVLARPCNRGMIELLVNKGASLDYSNGVTTVRGLAGSIANNAALSGILSEISDRGKNR